MPRERIWTKDTDFVPHVGWSEETVQLGISTADGKPIIDRIEDISDLTSIWATLERSDINKAIELLRKARDSAYGKDE